MRRNILIRRFALFRCVGIFCLFLLYFSTIRLCFRSRFSGLCRSCILCIWSWYIYGYHWHDKPKEPISPYKFQQFIHQNWTYGYYQKNSQHLFYFLSAHFVHYVKIGPFVDELQHFSGCYLTICVTDSPAHAFQVELNLRWTLRFT